MLIVLVCGGRDFGEPPSARIKRPAGVNWRAERNLVHATLDALHRDTGIHALVHGAARGADACADEWARGQSDVLCWRYPADWKKHGKAAGPIRNAAMLYPLTEVQHEDAGLVVAFPGGRGTADMVSRARRAGIRVVEVKP